MGTAATEYRVGRRERCAMENEMRHALSLILMACVSSSALAATYEIKRDVEGPYAFKLFGVEFNKGSSLQRESVLFNDPSCPIQLVANSMTWGYVDRTLQITSATQAIASQQVMALEVRHILFDVFGQHMRNLSNLDVRDFQNGAVALKGTWRLFAENDASELLTTVSYVARVRLPDGTQWVFNSDNLTSALGTLHLEKKIEDDKPAK